MVLTIHQLCKKRGWVRQSTGTHIGPGHGLYLTSGIHALNMISTVMVKEYIFLAQSFYRLGKTNKAEDQFPAIQSY
jgi:hypothetical protein